LLVQSGLLALVLVLASGGEVGNLEPGYVSGTIRAERAGPPTRPTGIDPGQSGSSRPSVR